METNIHLKRKERELTKEDRRLRNLKYHFQME